MFCKFNSKIFFFQKTLFTSIRQTAFWLGVLFTLTSIYGCRTPAAKRAGEELIENGSKIFQKGSQVLEKEDSKELMEKSAPLLLAPAIINPGTSRPDSESTEQPNENMNPDSQESEYSENNNPNEQETDNNENTNVNEHESENRE
jgi:hypothetical protein